MPASATRRAHWAVRLNYRNRLICFAGLAATLGMHFHAEGTGPAGWIALAGFWGAYPHLAFLRARRAADAMAAEIQNLALDAVWYGAFSGALGFPLWISFVLLMGCTVNLTSFRGVRGLATGLTIFGATSVLAFVLAGAELHPETDLPTTLLGITSLASFLWLVAVAAFERSMALHDAREEIRRKEGALQDQLAANESLQHRLREQADRDPLTGLFNRRYLAATMARDLQACVERDRVATVALLDVDHFKRINDTYGHAAGDAVLVALARLLSDGVRATDVVGRYGGEEFLVFLPGCSLEDARHRAESWRQACGALVVNAEGHTLRVTFSVGLASFPEHGATAEVLTRRADEALYRAKKRGRDRVEVAEGVVAA